MPFEIFILEDDDDFFHILSVRLKAWRPELNITRARTIAEGERILEGMTKSLLLAIVDQHLPDGRGTALLNHNKLQNCAVLAVSADTLPELPGDTLRAGAQHFLGKRQVTEPLFQPLLEALIDRKKLEMDLDQARVSEARLDAIKVLLSTLRHEMNNPLGAVLGGIFLLRTVGTLDKKQKEAIELIEGSSNRMKNVIEKLCETAELEEVTKANEKVFHVPGDKPWES